MKFRITLFFVYFCVSFMLISCASKPKLVVHERKPSLFSNKTNLIGASATYNTAKTLYEHGKYREAIEHFHVYIANYPKSELFTVSLYYLAHSYQEIGNFDQAQVLYNKLITTFDKNDFWVQQAERRVKQLDI